MFIVGDVGGTKINLALCEVKGAQVRVRSTMRYASSQFKSLPEAILRYVVEVQVPPKEIEGACFGVPGPVVDGKVPTVNLPWNLDCEEVRREVGRTLPLKALLLINDLEAAARGLEVLKEGKGLMTLRAGTPIVANKALLAPGTGLGEAILFWDGAKHVASGSEGGHTDFAPQNDEQVELLKWLWPRHKHVSWELIASGPGIHRIYRFLKETGREQEPEDLATLLAQPGVDPSPLIGARAQNETSGICSRAMDIWLFCLGAEAGNLGLKSLSRAGLYLGGGIIPNILDLLRRPAFFEGFNSKGRMSLIVNSMPVFAVTDPHAALYGAALAARDATVSTAT